MNSIRRYLFYCLFGVGLSACGSPSGDVASDPEAPDGGSPGAARSSTGADAGALPLSTLPECDEARSVFASELVEYSFGSGQDYGQDEFPENVFGPPEGGGCCTGSLDVVALGNGGWVTLGFGDNAIVDGPGADFIVFENAFGAFVGDTNVFSELATVSVSQDGVRFVDFPCTATEAPYGDCAGSGPVFASATENDIDPTDPATAGGDSYDIAELGLSYVRFVRITDRPDLDDALDGVFDLDAVAIVHGACPAD